MKRRCQEILEASRAQILTISEEPATNHEIGGCRMGSRSAHVHSGCHLPCARCSESLRGGRERLPVVIGEESDSNHHGARLAHRRFYCRPFTEEGSVMSSYSSDRRQVLKLFGAISATCAYPFAGDELYGQTAHEHVCINMVRRNRQIDS